MYTAASSYLSVISINRKTSKCLLDKITITNMVEEDKIFPAQCILRKTVNSEYLSFSGYYWMNTTYWFLCISKCFVLIFVVTSHHFVEPLLLSVLDFSWLCPWFQSQGGSIIACALFSLVLMIFRVNSKFQGLGLVLILHLGMVRLPLEWLPNMYIKILSKRICKIFQFPNQNRRRKLIHPIHLVRGNSATIPPV